MWPFASWQIFQKIQIFVIAKVFGTINQFINSLKVYIKVLQPFVFKFNFKFQIIQLSTESKKVEASM